MIYPLDAHVVTVVRKPPKRDAGGKHFDIDIDGIPVKYVTGVEWKGGADEVATVTLSFIAKLVVSDEVEL